MNNEVKKMPLVEKMAKPDDIDKLQQQVTKLLVKKQNRFNNVAELQAEVDKVTGIIHPIHEKVQRALDST